MGLVLRLLQFRRTFVRIRGDADETVEKGGDRKNRKNKEKTARKAPVLSHIAPQSRYDDDPI